MPLAPLPTCVVSPVALASALPLVIAVNGSRMPVMLYSSPAQLRRSLGLSGWNVTSYSCSMVSIDENVPPAEGPREAILTVRSAFTPKWSWRLGVARQPVRSVGIARLRVVLARGIALRRVRSIRAAAAAGVEAEARAPRLRERQRALRAWAKLQHERFYRTRTPPRTETSRRCATKRRHENPVAWASTRAAAAWSGSARCALQGLL